MSDVAIGIYVALICLVLGSLVSVFSPDIRAWIAGLSFKLPFPSRERRGKRVAKRIELLSELSKSLPAMLAYIMGQVFLAIIFLAFVMFFGFMVILRVHPVLSAIAFLIFWVWFIVNTALSLEVTVQLRNPQDAINRLQGVQP